MRISHPESPLYLDIKDDLRERDVMKWQRSLRAWRKREGVEHIPLSELSQNEYNLAVVSACIDAGWVLDSGRLPYEEDEQLIAPSQEGYQLPQAGNTDALLDFKHWVITWYATQLQLVYASLFRGETAPKKSGPQSSMPATEALS